MAKGNYEMKILIGASSSKIFHLKEFAKKLDEQEIKTRVVFDIDVIAVVRLTPITSGSGL